MIKTIPLYHLELVRDRSIPFVSLETSEQCAEILHELLDRSPVEQLLVMYMDAQFNLVGVEKVGLGSTLGVNVTMADIFRGAITASVPFIVLGHNHPSNSLTPSEADYDLTDKAKVMGMQLGVEVIDHIIVTPTGKHLSMKEEDFKKRDALASKVLDVIQNLPPEQRNVMEDRMRRLGLNPDLIANKDIDNPFLSLTDLAQYKLNKLKKDSAK